MSGNTFGTLFRVTTWGESHGPAVGAVVDGCPPGLDLQEADIQVYMDRRRPGGSQASTTRKESDTVRILSGVFEGKTTGCPICLYIANQDARSSSYESISRMFRPGHADITFHAKYGIRDWRGGGRASARETAARVAAGAVAQKVLDARRIRVSAYTRELGGVRAKRIDPAEVFANPYGCPDPDAVEKMESRIALVRAQGDSVGGIVEVIAHGVPAGLGEPVFGKLDADLAGALMGIGAVKGVEIGDGFAVAGTTGSTNNDPITPEGFSSNHAGGILGGISSGADIVIRVAVKPIPSISIPQQTVTVEGKPETIQIRGRHDISAIPRINAVCEAMVRLVLADHLLRQQALCFVA